MECTLAHKSYVSCCRLYVFEPLVERGCRTSQSRTRDAILNALYVEKQRGCDFLSVYLPHLSLSKAIV